MRARRAAGAVATLTAALVVTSACISSAPPTVLPPLSGTVVPSTIAKIMGWRDLNTIKSYLGNVTAVSSSTKAAMRAVLGATSVTISDLR